MSELRLKQARFSFMIAELILWVYDLCEGYEVTLGDAYSLTGHIKNSFHGKRLAIDLNLFKDDVYLTKTSDHELIGKKWKAMHPDNTWGGDFKRKDGNHYSHGEK